MGQSRTALVFGSTERPELPESYWDAADPYYGSDPSGLESGAIGFPFAVAYDDSRGCAEIEFPVDLSAIGTTYRTQLETVTAKWVAWKERITRDFNITVPDGVVFLDEVERA